MTTAAATAKRISKGKERALQIRTLNWPDVGDDELWNRTRYHGYTTIPRTIPILMNIIDTQSKNKPAGRTYFGLWCRTFDESLVIIENPMSLAFEAGFSGERAVTTWRQRMNTLKHLGFIDAKPGSSGEFHYVLLFNPHRVVWRLREQIPNQLFMQLFDRAVDIGAKDMKPPEEGEIAPPAKPAKKVKKVKKK